MSAQLLVALAIGFFAACGIYLVFLGLTLRSRAVAEIQAPTLSGGRYAAAAVARAPMPAPTDVRGWLVRMIQPVADRLEERRRERKARPMADLLARADLKLRVSEYYLLQLGSTLAFGLIALLRFGFGLQVVLFAAVGAFIPGLYVRYRQGARVRAFNGQLGDTLVILSNALRSGYALTQAMDTVGKTATPPISAEFARTVRELTLGGTLDGALAAMVRRIRSTDLELVTMAIAIHHQAGGNLAEVLESIASTIRDRVRLKEEALTVTAQARLSAWIITVLPIAVAVFMYFLVPGYFHPMTQEPLGWVLIAIALVMLLAGNTIIRRIVAIKV